MNEVILSICIPTFNRADKLDKTIASIINQKFDKNTVEIVISDNCSTDETVNVITKYKNIYKNIKHIRQDPAIWADNNIINSLKYGQGIFLKLCNDTACFNDGSVEKILLFINKYKEKKPILTFSNIDKSSRNYENINLNNFIFHNSYNCTSILTVGIWKDDLALIKNLDEAFEYMMPAVNIYRKYFDLKNIFVVYNENLFNVQYIKNKGGYNLIDVFVGNYLGIVLKSELNANRISLFTYEIEKIKVLKGFVAPWMKLLKKKESGFTFSIEGANKKLFKVYYYNPLFYLMVIYFFTFDLIQKLRN